MNPVVPFKYLPYYVKGPKHNAIRGIYCLIRRFNSNDSPPDDNNNNKKNQLAIDKLNELLKSMKRSNDVDKTTKTSKRIELAQPRQLAKKSEENRQQIEKLNQKQKLGEKLATAAANVALEIGGDTKKTESELLNLLRIYNDEVDDLSEKKPKSSVQLGDLLLGMKIDRTQSKADSSNLNIDRAQRVKKLLSKNFDGEQKVIKYKNVMNNYKPINLFDSNPLGIFTNLDSEKKYPTLSTWDKLYEKSLQLAVTHPPSNIYEQMIIWTEQGKLWKFPINNEQGLEDENNVFFAEHVFLEPLIDEWCPMKGPIRHFMELVCIGLSKNPFLSVEEKKDHINWFRQYFYEKNQLLNEVGALEIKSLPENVKEYYKPTIPNE